MNISIGPRGLLMIDDARITYKNFSGEEKTFNKKGDRNFSLIIPNEDIKDLLLNEVNEYGVSWNVKIKAPRPGYDEPFMHLPVKVKFNGRGPNVYLITGNNRRKLSEEEIGMLDHIDIDRVDMDIAPSDGEGPTGDPFRAAYLRTMEVVQRLDRFTARYMEENEEMPFED